MQVLAANARKVSAIRFERIPNSNILLESKDVARVVPKIRKRSWGSDDESDENSNADELQFQESAGDDNTEKSYSESQHQENKAGSLDFFEVADQTDAYDSSKKV